MKGNETIDGERHEPLANHQISRGGKRILIPLDLMRGTVDPLLFVQGLGVEAPVRVTLLHVVSLNVAVVERRIYRELCSEAQAGLLKLARLFFGEDVETRVSVRIGRPHEEIIEEARSDASELIILSASRPGSWARLLGLGTAERVVRSAPCATLILPRKNATGSPPTVAGGAGRRTDSAQLFNSSNPNSCREGILTEASTRTRAVCDGGRL